MVRAFLIYHTCTTFYASFTTFLHVLRVHETIRVNISVCLVFGLYMRQIDTLTTHDSI